jgi:butyryl-CoA dehydrogenase
MPNIINRRDLDFLLYDFLQAEKLCDLPKYADHSRDLFDQIIDAAEKLAEDVFQPIAAVTDVKEPEFATDENGGKAIFPQETYDAVQAMVDGGFISAGFDAEWGGLQLPYLITQGAASFMGAANGGIGGYSMLTVAAANLLVAHASDEQKQKFVPPMVEGRFFGTMCLSEPQAGSSLADIRTRAEPQGDGTYRVFGNKMWISGGEHDLSENIIHLVLAKVPGGPAGVKGISLFIVPRLMVGEDGALGERNDVQLAGVNHKMGNRATINTVLNFGEKDGAVGYLIGEEGKGLSYMFHMMNEARIGVGLAAATTAYTGYLHALEYAKDRKQGRAPDGKDPTTDMIPIIDHADVKRMLMQQKAYSEGALALCLYGAMLIDLHENEENQEEKERLNLLLEILTPVMKSWPSEFGPRANDQAIQVHGGYGYTREYPVERLYRDNRLNPIHEGTKGIQGMDLLGRKVIMKNGAALQALDAEIRATLEEAGKVDAVSDEAEKLAEAWALIIETTRAMAMEAATQGPKAYLANATLYLDAFGHVVVAWVWLRQALLAAQADGSDDFYKGKLAACRYFFRYELPNIQPTCDLLKEMDKTCLEADAAWF